MTRQVERDEPIGVFDSGIGGLSVLRHLRRLLPKESLIYIADQAHVPYGARSRQQITNFSEGISRFLLDHRARLIVVACNTASAAALTSLRQKMPGVPFVGMEPAVKPGANQTQSGKIGILATPHTLTSPRYASLVSRFADGVQTFENPCLGLVEMIEAGMIDAPQTESLLIGILQPMLAEGVDTIVLACTHYPFVLPVIERVIRSLKPRRSVQIIDPAPAVAQQAVTLLERSNTRLARDRTPRVSYLTTSDGDNLAWQIRQLLNEAAEVEELQWQIGRLTPAAKAGS